MFTAFTRLSDNTVKRLESVETLADAWEKDDTVVWVDLEEPTEGEVRALDRIIRVDEAALEDCLHGEQRPRIDEYDDYVFVVAYGAVVPEPNSGFDPRKLAIFCGKRFLITVHREPVRTIATIRERCDRHPERVLANGVDVLLYQIIDMMVDNFVDVADTYESRLEELEEKSLARSADESVLADMLDLRRDLLELRRVAAAQRELLSPLADGELDYVSEELAQRFSHVRDHLIKAVELIDAQRERLAGVRDNYHTALASRTNDAMRTLTVFAAVLLPLSVVAGIYGMNLPLWPSPEHPSSFWIVLAAMVAMGGGFLLYFKRRGWL
ncbi:MAG: magnesium/cobalt transporter CorA [Planctomycetes bacterium]|nr:magnesium/cobalt transporter CorA [Planctomycetota bacterium]